MKERLFYCMLGVFVFWLLLGFVGLSWIVLTDVSKLDPVLTLLGGLGWGIVLEFFIFCLTLSWNYWFRKKTPVEKSPEEK